MKLVSIVVPIYNVEQYLTHCIKTILQQSYENLEIILVDDGSPDNCGKMCDEFAMQDRRIKVIHKQNGGLSDARNAGIDVATGDYIMFIDSDDYVMPSFHETFGLVYAEAMSQGLPVIYTRGQGFDEQFEDGAVGYAVNASSAEEIADKIKRIWDDYEKIRENCLRSFQKFHWDKIVALYFDIYKRYGV